MATTQQTGWYLALKTQHDTDLGRDYALIGKQFRGPLETREQAEELLAKMSNIVDSRILHTSELESWKPRKQRLDEYLKVAGK